MIRVEGRGAVYGELWYDEVPAADSGVDIIRYLQRNAPLADARCTPFLSLVTDLSVPEAAITGEFGKNCRYKIRRADTKDGLSVEFIMGPENRLDEFSKFYDAFARQKSIEPADRRWLVAACRARQLVLTSARRDGMALVWHAYVLCGKTVRLQHSASDFRNKNSDRRARVGRANRWLHWKEMLQFKKMGYVRYDWGGLFADESAPERAGINQFKKDFGGRQELTYNCTLPVTFRGRIWLTLRDAWHHRMPAPVRAVRNVVIARFFPS